MIANALDEMKISGTGQINDIEIVRIDPQNHLDEIYDFNRSVWPAAWSSDRDLLYWRIVTAAKSPITRTTCFALLDRNSRLHGLICGIPGSALVGGEVIQLTWPVDFVLSPSLRGKGFGKKLIQLFAERQPNVTGVGGTDKALLLYRSLGWPVRDDLKIYFKILKPASYLLKRKKNRSNIKRTFRSLMRRNKTDSPRLESSASMHEVANFYPEISAVVERFAPKSSVVTLRPEDLVRWQCVEAPFARSRYFVLKERGETTGYMILRLHATKEGLQEARVIDIFCRDLDTVALEFMIVQAISISRDLGADQLRLLASHPNLRKACLNTGFFENQGPALIHMSTPQHGVDTLDWHITMIDSDYAYR